jgi:peptidoglycan hydrolase-like protein with peptidoglycan-binding domain
MEKTIAKLAIPTKPVELTRELKLGDSGNEVELLQVWLRQEPLVYPEGKVTGYFGKLTQEAVIRFQEKYAAEILAPQGFSKGTGIVDSYTRIKLNELYGKSGIIPTVPEITSDLRYGDHGNEVKLLQTWLAKDKEIYPEGKISGWFGYATQRAVIRFQEKYASEILTPQGLSRGSGIVDALTRKKLNQLFGNK